MWSSLWYPSVEESLYRPQDINSCRTPPIVNYRNIIEFHFREGVRPDSQFVIYAYKLPFFAAAAADRPTKPVVIPPVILIPRWETSSLPSSGDVVLGMSAEGEKRRAACRRTRSRRIQLDGMHYWQLLIEIPMTWVDFVWERFPDKENYGQFVPVPIRMYTI